MLSNLYRYFLNSAARLSQHCVLCGVGGQGWLCPPCRADLPRLAVGRCPRCAMPGRQGMLCAACRQSPPPWQALHVAHPYAWPLDALLHAFKYRQQLALARPLAELMAEGVRHAPRPDWLAPIPLSAARLRERGFNQSEELARQLGKILRLPCHADTLLRTRDTPAQAGLNRAGRLHNLADAFAVNRPVEGRFIVLIDDVSTTGATLAEAAQSLARQGARRVEAWALMKALTHGA